MSWLAAPCISVPASAVATLLSPKGPVQVPTVLRGTGEMTLASTHRHTDSPLTGMVLPFFRGLVLAPAFPATVALAEAASRSAEFRLALHKPCIAFPQRSIVLRNPETSESLQYLSGWMFPLTCETRP